MELPERFIGSRESNAAHGHYYIILIRISGCHNNPCSGFRVIKATLCQFRCKPCSILEDCWRLAPACFLYMLLVSIEIIIWRPPRVAADQQRTQYHPKHSTRSHNSINQTLSTRNLFYPTHYRYSDSHSSSSPAHTTTDYSTPH